MGKKKEKAHVRLARELRFARAAALGQRKQYEAGEAELRRQADIAQKEIIGKNSQIASKNEAILQRDRELEIARDKVKMKEAELARVDRLVDQFLSVQIIGHGQDLSQRAGTQGLTGLRRT